MGMTWGEFAAMIGFEIPDVEDVWDYGEYDSAWVKFRQWAGFRWDDESVDSDKPIGTDKAFQLLLLRMGQLGMFKEKE
jgi:hypothetical protein